LFATGVSLITATHETSLQSRRDNVEYAEPITIGDDCWLGANVTIFRASPLAKAARLVLDLWYQEAFRITLSLSAFQQE